VAADRGRLHSSTRTCHAIRERQQPDAVRIAERAIEGLRRAADQHLDNLRGRHSQLDVMRRRLTADHERHGDLEGLGPEDPGPNPIRQDVRTALFQVHRLRLAGRDAWRPVDSFDFDRTRIVFERHHGSASRQGGGAHGQIQGPPGCRIQVDGLGTGEHQNGLGGHGPRHARHGERDRIRLDAMRIAGVDQTKQAGGLPAELCFGRLPAVPEPSRQPLVESAQFRAELPPSRPPPLVIAALGQHLVRCLDGREASFQADGCLGIGPRDKTDFQPPLFLQPLPSPAGQRRRRDSDLIQVGRTKRLVQPAPRLDQFLTQWGRQQRHGEKAIDPIGGSLGRPACAQLVGQLLRLALDPVAFDLVAQAVELVQQPAQLVQFPCRDPRVRHRQAVLSQQFFQQIPQRRQPLIDQLPQRLVQSQGLGRPRGCRGMPSHVVHGAKGEFLVQLNRFTEQLPAGERLFVRGSGLAGEKPQPSFGQPSQHRPAIDASRKGGALQDGGQRQDLALQTRRDLLRLESPACPETLLVPQQRFLILAPQVRCIVGRQPDAGLRPVLERVLRGPGVSQQPPGLHPLR
jgi:hypothetical protein